MMGVLSLITGNICIVITFCIYIPEMMKADTVKEKWMEVFDFFTNPLIGSSLFYLGQLLMQ